MDTETLTPEAKATEHPCRRCGGAGRIILITGEKQREIICCWCGGHGERKD